jgi:methanogenic corrinoid protein MtbC1
MAANFGISELRSKFDDWRQGRKSGSLGVPNSEQSEPYVCQIVDDPKGAADLSLLLENLVIPKLIADRGNPQNRLSEQGLAETIGTDRKRPITPQDVEAFTALTIDAEAGTLLDFVDNCLATGSSVEAIYVDLLAPSARRLGEFWEKDSEDFVDVTMGLWRIQEILRELALRVPPPIGSAQGRRSALFSTMPGEQHSLGTLMVAECFQRAGWDTDVMIEPSQSELTAKVANRHYELAGLTLSNDCPTSALTSLITSIRTVSSNPDICIMIGGRFVIENPEVVDESGANGTAADAASAIALANRLAPARAAMPDLLI